jgi:hypothetical protein
MQQIYEKSHYATLISSLNKEYKKIKIGKSLTPNDIYLLDIVYNLLQEINLTLSDEEKNKLLKIYNILLYNSKVICNNTYNEVSQMSKIDKFIQAEKTDCNNIPSETILGIISYWQEDSITNTIEDIIPEINNRVKLYTTYTEFSIGKTITYSNIGRICFLLNNETSVNYLIYDALNNNITSLFDIQYILDINSVIIVSKSIYSYGDIKFKIIKNN